MSKEHAAPQGFVKLVEGRYDLKVIDSHYILVDEKYKQYNMMLNVQFNEKMAQAFQEKYGKDTSAMHVAWEHCAKTKSIAFYATIGNNILLLWDTLIDA